MLAASYTEQICEAGCDEAGRGCLAGPVFAAAVIFHPGYQNDAINDSKKLTRDQRLQLREIICLKSMAWSVAQIGPDVIDEINILNASFLAMEDAVKNLTVQPELLLIDGNRFRTSLGIPFTCFTGGDGRFLTIAAASILAKTFRDEYMESIHYEYPVYDWQRNKGYPTAWHRKAILSYGLSPYHRRTFHINEQLRLKL